MKKLLTVAGLLMLPVFADEASGFGRRWRFGVGVNQGGIVVHRPCDQPTLVLGVGNGHYSRSPRRDLGYFRTDSRSTLDLYGGWSFAPYNLYQPDPRFPAPYAAWTGGPAPVESAETPKDPGPWLFRYYVDQGLDSIARLDSAGNFSGESSPYRPQIPVPSSE